MKFLLRLDVLLVVASMAATLAISRISIFVITGAMLIAATLSRWDQHLLQQAKPIPTMPERVKAGAGIVGLAITLGLLVRWGGSFQDRGEALAVTACTLVVLAVYLGGCAAISHFAQQVWQLPPPKIPFQ